MQKHEEFPEKKLKAMRKKLVSDCGTDPIASNQASASNQPSAISSDVN